MVQGLKPKEKLVLDYITSKIDETGYAPSVRDICSELSIKSTSTAQMYIEKLEAKGFIKRENPGFICTPLISQNQMQKVEANSLVKKVFGGSRKALFSALLEDEPLSEDEINELRKLIDNR